MATESVEIMLKLPKSVLALMDSTETSIGQTIMEQLLLLCTTAVRFHLEKPRKSQGISVWQMNQILAKHDVSLDYTAEDAAQDWNTLREVFRLSAREYQRVINLWKTEQE